MVRTIHDARLICCGLYVSNTNYLDVIGRPNGVVTGKGALRGIRIQNLVGVGWWQSGFQQLRITVDGIPLASGQIRVPYIDGQRPGRGHYLNLGQYVLGADYHEEPHFSGSGACCDCAMLVNNQRIPFHRSLRIEAAWTSSGSCPSGFWVDVWYEIKGI